MEILMLIYRNKKLRDCEFLLKWNHLKHMHLILI